MIFNFLVNSYFYTQKHIYARVSSNYTLTSLQRGTAIVSFDLFTFNFGTID